MEPLNLPLHDTVATKPAMATFSAPGSSHGYEQFVRSDTLWELPIILNYDSFAVRVDLRVVKAEEPPPSDMHRHLGNLLFRKEHTDVEFRVGEETFAAHRLLLGARSSPEFKAKLLLGSNTDVVQIDDMEPRVFKAMLTFMYTDSWPEMESKDEEAAICQRLFVAADQYALWRLKLMCESRLCNLIDENSLDDIFKLAEKHQCTALREACFDFCGSTALLLQSRKKLLALREDDEPYFDNSVSFYPTIIKDQIFNVLQHDWNKEEITAINMTLEIYQ